MLTRFDTIVVGGGLAGLVLVHRLHRGGHRVALLEARECLGGSARRRSAIEFFPASQANVDLIEWARSVSPTPVHMEIREHHPYIFDEGRWRQFSGFGESDFGSVSELAGLSHPHEIAVEPEIDLWVRLLCDHLPVAAQTRSELTALRVEKGRVQAAVVNGDREFGAEQFIFTANPSFLNALIDGEGLSAKTRSRLAKTLGWTAVTLELRHASPLAQDSSVRVFTHNAKDFEPVVGRCYGSNSVWMTLVPHERDGDHEFAGQVIRHIKRQLKRAWPELETGLESESICVQAHAFGQHDLKSKNPFLLPEIENMYLANHALGRQSGALGSLEVVRELEKVLFPSSSGPEISLPVRQ